MLMLWLQVRIICALYRIRGVPIQLKDFESSTARKKWHQHFKGVPSTVSFDFEVSNLFVCGLVMTLQQ